jgi:hypothetical protein
MTQNCAIDRIHAPIMPQIARYAREKQITCRAIASTVAPWL